MAYSEKSLSIEPLLKPHYHLIRGKSAYIYANYKLPPFLFYAKTDDHHTSCQMFIAIPRLRNDRQNAKEDFDRTGVRINYYRSTRRDETRREQLPYPCPRRASFR